jgi:hypothetical protein
MKPDSTLNLEHTPEPSAEDTSRVLIEKQVSRQ